jgi:glycosyltransferase involved in cell wall biosynthesis
MSPQPLVTIVTPSYNQAEFIRRTIESVLSQDYPNIEYIVMDGGSTDGTAEVVAPYLHRLIWISERDRGQTHAINKGFQRATGEIVAWLNSDDLLLPGAVSAAVRAFETSPNAGAVYGEGLCIDREGRTTMRFPGGGAFNLWRLTWLCDYILQQATFFRRAAVEEAGWLDESLHWAMDWDILVRLGKRYGLAYTPEEMGCLREYVETKTASGGAKRFRELRTLLQRQTGSRWPPGCWYYGLDTYDKIWSGAILRAGLGPLRPLARYFAMRLVHLCRHKIDRTALHAQGYYQGGYAARVLRWMAPAGVRQILIEGEVPEWCAASGEQSIDVWSGRQLLARRALGTGPFHWAIDAPPGLADDALNLEFRAKRAAGPPSALSPRPPARVAWRVRSIESRP